eukprot:SAG31_NODE_1174_length_9538_cov_3.152453_7_plen_261_part_00
MFERFDADKSGFIEASELRALSAVVGSELTEEQASQTIAHLDTDGDGKISFDEFAAWLKAADEHTKYGTEVCPPVMDLDDPTRALMLTKKMITIWGDSMHDLTRAAYALQPEHSQEIHERIEAARKDSGLGRGTSKMVWKLLAAKTAVLVQNVMQTDHPMLLQQHQWLEATDPKHRYGTELFEYYRHWCAQASMHVMHPSLLPTSYLKIICLVVGRRYSETSASTNFFYWLDHGKGKGFTFTPEQIAAGVPKLLASLCGW